MSKLRGKTTKSIFVAVCLAVLLLFSYMSQSSMAYTSKPKSSTSHTYAIEQAIPALQTDRYYAAYSEANTYKSNIIDGAYDADWSSGTVFGHPVNALYHFHDPNVHIGYSGFTTAATWAQMFFDEAISQYKNGDKASAYYLMGFALHTVQDLTVPHHASLAADDQDQHSNYESYVANNHATLRQQWDGHGDYTFGSVPLHYSPQSAWGWVDYAAHTSYPYINQVDDPGEDFGAVAEVLFPFAISLTAGFIAFFYQRAFEATHKPGDQLHYTTGTLSGSGATSTSYVDLPQGTYTIILAGDESDDFDLYVRWNYPPTTSTYDGRGYTSTSLEKVEVTGKGRLYIMARSFSGSGHFRVHVLYGAATHESKQSGTLSSTGATSTKSINVGNWFTSFRGWVFMSGPGNADFDLYIKWNAKPTTSSYDDVGYSGYSDEAADTSWYSTLGGTFYGMARAYRGSGEFYMLFLVFIV